jgi:hypothetical protein
MGIILSGILGGFSGKVGPVVGGKWKDIDYMRSYVIPANPNTAGQQTVRTRFAELVAYSRNLLSVVLQTYWDPFYSNMSGFNAFMSENYSLLDGSNIITANNIFSKGTLEPLHGCSAVYTSGTGVVQFTNDGTIQGNGLGTDSVFLGVIHKTTKQVWVVATGVGRSSPSGAVNITTGLTATDLVAFAFCYRGTGPDLIVSDSMADVCAAP